MRLPWAFLFLLLLGAGSPPEAAQWPHEIAGLVLLAAENNADLQAATGLDSLQVAEKLFTALPAEPSSEDLWRALYQVRRMLDGAGTEEFAHQAFLLCSRHPLVFYQRFVSGDSRALLLQDDVFLEDTFVLHGEASTHQARTREVRDTLDRIVRAVRQVAPPPSSEEPQLHAVFLARLEVLRVRWAKERAALVRDQ